MRIICKSYINETVSVGRLQVNLIHLDDKDVNGGDGDVGDDDDDVGDDDDDGSGDDVTVGRLQVNPTYLSAPPWRPHSFHLSSTIVFNTVVATL